MDTAKMLWASPGQWERPRAEQQNVLQGIPHGSKGVKRNSLTTGSGRPGAGTPPSGRHGEGASASETGKRLRPVPAPSSFHRNKGVSS